MFEERPRPRRKIPLRTLILMVIALVAFARFYWVSQQRRAPEPKRGGPLIIEVVPPSAPVSADAGAP